MALAVTLVITGIAGAGVYSWLDDDVQAAVQDVGVESTPSLTADFVDDLINKI